ncbi:MAG TPA: hypothetical protein VGK67_10600 [Myxococcales bacterium]
MTTRVLLRKELREHWAVLLALAFAGLVAYAIAVSKATDGGSEFVAVRNFSASFALLIALVVCNRLIIREWSGRTQLFLEALPVTRLSVVTTKFLLGAALVALPVLAVLAVSALRASRWEPVTARYVAIVGARGLAFSLTFYSLAFLAAMLGRLRVGLWMALLLAWYTLEQVLKIDLMSLPLMRLVEPQMAFERHAVPWDELASAAGVGLALLLGAFALAMARDGSVASRLARRLQPREKVFFGCLGMAYLFMLFAIDEHRDRPAFDLAEIVRAAKGRTVVGVGKGEGLSDERANQLGELVAGDLEALQGFLGLQAKPAVFLIPSHGMDPDLFQRAQLPNADGVVIKAALASPALDERDLRAFVVGEVLSWHSRGRLTLEPRLWLLDGFARAWIAQGRLSDRELLRFAAAGVVGVPEDVLERWYANRERLGPCLADAVAQVAVTSLAEELGPARYQAFAREALAVRPEKDLRALLSEKSLEEIHAAHSGGAPRRFSDLVREKLAQVRADQAAALADLASLSASQTAVRVTRTSAEVRHQLRSSDPARTDLAYAFRYAELGPWTGGLDPEDLGRIDTVGQGVMPFVPPLGTRLFTAFEVQDARLGCAVRLSARRWEVQ